MGTRPGRARATTCSKWTSRSTSWRDILGEELQLPHIEPRGKEQIVAQKIKYTGVNTTGPESLRHFKRTFKQALRRQIALGTYDPAMPDHHPHPRGPALPQLDELQNLPETNAVIIYMMDVSGSMGDEQKEIVRIESFWIDTWLRHQYKGLETRYIIHDAVAREVDERPSSTPASRGGTMISSAYKLCREIIDADYPPAQLEHLPVPLLRRRQLERRRHAALHRDARGATSSRR